MLSLRFISAAIAFVMFELALSSPIEIARRQDDFSAPGITYSPYKGTAGASSCKTQAEVQADIDIIAKNHHSVIRTYGLDCNQVQHVYSACKAKGIKLFPGIYDVDNLSNQVDELAKQLGNDWSMVHTVSCGNEFVLQGKKSAGEMVGLTNQARALLRKKGYKGPVVTVECFYEYLQNPALCEGSDYIACNAHPFFDGKVLPENAGSWLQEMIKQVSAKCNKKVIITETGWPTQGGNNGVSVPSKQNQDAAISSIKKTCGNNIIFFTAFNDYWKTNHAGTAGAEQFWGLYTSSSP